MRFDPIFGSFRKSKLNILAASEYIKQLQSYEEYAFSWEELVKNCDSPETTLRKELIRLSNKNELINLRHGFYLIIPPRYSNLGKIPAQLYVEKLFAYLDKPYYIALFSAASLHGAAHQQIQKEYIITTPPALRDIQKKGVSLDFMNAKSWSSLNIIQKKSDAGLFKVSSPALTAADLVHYHTRIGGINRVLANLEELIEEISIEDIQQLLSWYEHTSTLQRLGFLMDELEMDSERSDLIFNKLKEHRFYPILLSPKKQQKAGSTGNRWKVDVNLKLENDL